MEKFHIFYLSFWNCTKRIRNQQIAYWRPRQLVNIKNQFIKKILLISQKYLVFKSEYKGIKISGIGRQFEKYSDRDKNGKMPYLYESDIPKIERIRKKIYTKTFKTTNTVKHDLFGFPSTNLKKDRRPYSLQTLDKLEKIQH